MRTVILGLAFLFAAGCSPGSTPGNGAATATRQAVLEPLSARGQQELRTIVDSGHLAELQWADFSDYGKWVKEFYESGAYELAWTHGGKPTAQASELITILDDAGAKGLDSKDYDGERWAGRIKTLDGAAGQEDHARVAFDVALTVSAMRYISDSLVGVFDASSPRSGWPITTNRTRCRGIIIEAASTTSGVIAVSARSVSHTIRLRRF